MEKKFEKLTAYQVKEIREKYATGQYSQKELGQKFGVSQKYIAGVVQGVVKLLPTAKQRLQMDKNRFMSKVDTNGGEDACWNWTAAKDRDGYGKFRLNGRIERASRVSYIFFKRKIPNRQVVRHRCDSPACVNPKHLVSGTHGQNNQDMIQRRRNYIGGSQPKRNELQMLEAIIFNDLGITQHRIARYLGVAGSTVIKYLMKDPFELQRRWIEKERASNE